MVRVRVRVRAGVRVKVRVRVRVRVRDRYLFAQFLRMIRFVVVFRLELGYG